MIWCIRFVHRFRVAMRPMPNPILRPHRPICPFPICRDHLGQPRNNLSISHRCEFGTTDMYPYCSWSICGRHLCARRIRNGVLLSTVIRDFQFNVTACEPTEIELEADAVPFASAELMDLVPYQNAIGLPDVINYPNGDSFDGGLARQQ